MLARSAGRHQATGEIRPIIRELRADPALRGFEKIGNRVVISIVVAGVINGLAVLLTVRPEVWQGRATLFFTIAFVLVIVLGVYLVWAIFRPTRD